MITFISLEPCEIAVTAVRGDYAGFVVQVGSACAETPIQLDEFQYSAELWTATRRVDDSNPAGGLVLVEKKFDFLVEQNQASDPPSLIVSLTASDTSTLEAETEYHWHVKWFTDAESIKTIAHGPFKVIS